MTSYFHPVILGGFVSSPVLSHYELIRILCLVPRVQELTTTCWSRSWPPGLESRLKRSSRFTRKVIYSAVKWEKETKEREREEERKLLRWLTVISGLRFVFTPSWEAEMCHSEWIFQHYEKPKDQLSQLPDLVPTDLIVSCFAATDELSRSCRFTVTSLGLRSQDPQIRLQTNQNNMFHI